MNTPTRLCQGLIDGIDTCTEWLGRGVAWLTLLMVIITALVVALRYLFNINYIGMQESITYLHASVFMLAAGYALKRNAHVRVDIFYRGMSAKGQAWVDLLGGLFLLMPVCAFIGWSSLDYVASSWALRESSSEPGGIPAVFLLKTLIPALAITLFLQGLAETLRNTLIVIGALPTDLHHTHSPDEGKL